VTTDLELDGVLAAWLGEGAHRAPDEDVAAALRQVDQTRQRHAVLARRAGARSPWAGARAWLAAAVMLVVVVGAVTWVGSGSVPVAARSIGANDFPWTAAAPAPETVAFTALLPAGTPEGLYWRAAVFNSFELSGWTQSGVETVAVPAGERLPIGSATELPEPTTELKVTIQSDPSGSNVLLSPGMPVAVDADASVSLIGGWFAGAELSGRTSFTVEARLPQKNDAGAVSRKLLRTAGQNYPLAIAEHYTAVPPGALGPAARALLQAILDSTPSRNPYDLAAAVESYLRDPARFTYSTDPDMLVCGSPSAVECLAQTRTGYCLGFASTMAILLRAAVPDHPIPTRLVQGFLPGTRSGNLETVPSFAAHAWVDVFFPGYGWIPFDPTVRVPTPVIVEQPPAIPEGPRS
jgi:hypothetical protein